MKAIYLDDEVHHRLKLRAAERGVSLQRLVDSYVRAGLGRSPSGAADVTTAEVTAAAATGGAFGFWAREEEEQYLPTDGEKLA